MRLYNSLKDRRIFIEAKRQKPFFTRFFSVRIMKNDLQHLRLGIIVNKRLGNAVTRIKCKRRIKNYIDRLLQENTFEFSHDVILVIRSELINADFADLYECIKKYFDKILIN